MAAKLSSSSSSLVPAYMEAELLSLLLLLWVVGIAAVGSLSAVSSCPAVGRRGRHSWDTAAVWAVWWLVAVVPYTGERQHTNKTPEAVFLDIAVGTMTPKRESKRELIMST